VPEGTGVGQSQTRVLPHSQTGPQLGINRVGESLWFTIGNGRKARPLPALRRGHALSAKGLGEICALKSVNGFKEKIDAPMTNVPKNTPRRRLLYQERKRFLQKL